MKFSMLRGSMASAGMLAALAVLAAPQASQAQAQKSGTRFGVEAAFGANNSVGIGVGAFVKFHLAELNEHPITGRASFDWFFPGNSYCGGYAGCGAHYYKLAGDGLYDIANPNSNVKPYIGAGLEYTHYSYGSGYCGYYGGGCGFGYLGLDLVGGINFAANTKLMPFVELNLAASTGSEFLIKAGVHF